MSLYDGIRYDPAALKRAAVSMLQQTKEQNRATVTHCANRGWCSHPNYERQDKELEFIKQDKRHHHVFDFAGNCRCGMSRVAKM